MKLSEIRIGDRVTWNPDDPSEQGVVKGFSDWVGGDCALVVVKFGRRFLKVTPSVLRPVKEVQDEDL